MTTLEKIPLGLLHSTEELRNLIIENPDLPLLVFAGQDCNCGDWMYMSCGYCHAALGEFLDCHQNVNSEKCYCDRDDFQEDLEYMYEDAYDDEWIAAELKSYDPYWKKCIILYVDN